VRALRTASPLGVDVGVSFYPSELKSKRWLLFQNQAKRKRLGFVPFFQSLSFSHTFCVVPWPITCHAIPQGGPFNHYPPRSRQKGCISDRILAPAEPAAIWLTHGYQWSHHTISQQTRGIFPERINPVQYMVARHWFSMGPGQTTAKPRFPSQPRPGAISNVTPAGIGR
jgi:hypothetical protein